MKKSFERRKDMEQRYPTSYMKKKSRNSELEHLALVRLLILAILGHGIVSGLLFIVNLKGGMISI